MHDPNAPSFLRFVAVAAMLWTGVTACDSEPAPDDVERSLPCNLADEACAALPAAADALALVESMDIEVDEADVELLADPSELEGLQAASFGALTTEERPPEQRFSCSGNDEWTCCCFWETYWGCGCF